MHAKCPGMMTKTHPLQAQCKLDHRDEEFQY